MDGTSVPKSRFQGALYSILLPGMGEIYAGRLDRAIPALIAEGILWLGYAGFTSYSGWIEEDARNFAVDHAGIQPNGKSDQYFVDIGNFDNVHIYNATKLLDREIGDLYPAESGSSYSWSWDTRVNRKEYNDLRVLSDEMLNASRFVIAGLIINRIWSAIQASFLVRDYNSRIQQQPRVTAIPLRTRGKTDGLALSVRIPF